MYFKKNKTYTHTNNKKQKNKKQAERHVKKNKIAFEGLGDILPLFVVFHQLGVDDQRREISKQTLSPFLYPYHHNYTIVQKIKNKKIEAHFI